MKPFCFVLMPFGTKTDGNKKEINFDKVYETFIKKAIEEALLDPIRADEEKGGGFIHKPMYERLLFCSFAIADLSFANANVFYELGIRHAAKPCTTISVYEINTKLPFDVAALRAFPYEFKDGVITGVDEKIKELAKLIKVNINVSKTQLDSPIAQIITQYKFPDLDELQSTADTFTDWVNNTKTIKNQLNNLVKQWKQADAQTKKPGLTEQEKQTTEALQSEAVQKMKDAEIAAADELHYNYDLVYSFLNAYKSANAFKHVVQLLSPFKESQKDNIYLQQQLALALNKTKQREDAEAILAALISKYGSDPETNGLLGAVYKGMMDDNKDDEIMKTEYCRQSVNAYIAGFDADPRDYYPGVNALTLMFLGEDEDERFNKYFPLVKYAVDRQLAIKTKDYWLQATALELSALKLSEADTKKYLSAALFCKPDKWEKETTATNLNKIYNKAQQSKTSEELKWLMDAIEKLS